MEQLPAEPRVEVIHFPEFVLAKLPTAEQRRQTLQQWLKEAPGAATSALTTDQIVQMTRGE